MDYSTLLDMATELGYRLAMAGAETYRVEESILRNLTSYGVEAEVYAVNNCLIVSIRCEDGSSMTRMKRIGTHGNDLDAVERYNNLSRRICSELPDPHVAMEWFRDVEKSRKHYSYLTYLLGTFTSGFGFALLFGGTINDCFYAGICGAIVGICNRFMDELGTNDFFKTIFSAFIMTLCSYATGALGLAGNTDIVIIGALMMLVPGILFTNALRDVIFGDINSGLNKIIQVLLIAAGIGIGTGIGWNLFDFFWDAPVPTAILSPNYFLLSIGSCLGCIGFIILLNIHGGGTVLCMLGGLLAWSTYYITLHWTANVVLANFVGGVVGAAFAEIMARVRKYPTICYLVISVIPMIPGAGIYYTTNYLVKGDMTNFAAKGMETVSIAGAIAIGILLVSTLVRLYTQWHIKRAKKVL